MKTLFKHLITKVLEWESKVLIKRLKPRIIAVSGSVGKTSTKDALYTALTPFATVRKSDKSFNSEIGIPLTILGLPNAWNNPFKWIVNVFKGLGYALLLKEYPKYLILEVGSDRPGDIARVAAWLPVYVAVLTRLPDTPVHVEFFKDGHEVNEEDKKILKALTKDGIIIMNADDAEMADIPSRYPTHTKVSYGFSTEATVRAQDSVVTYSNDNARTPTGMQCTARVRGTDIPLSISGSLGRQHIYPMLAAVALVDALGFNTTEAISVLLGHESPKGRMRIIPGIHSATIIDDTYNSSPVAVEEALSTLKAIETKGKKIAVLGDMLELGIYTEREHVRVGTHAKECVDVLVTIGLRAEDFITGAVAAGMDKNMTHMYPEPTAAMNYLKKHVGEGDIVLVKGSQGMRLERIVQSLMRDPEQAKHLLVRQEKEWEHR